MGKEPSEHAQFAYPGPEDKPHSDQNNSAVWGLQWESAEPLVKNKGVVRLNFFLFCLTNNVA